MKPSEKERLVKSRPALVRSLEVTTVLPLLLGPDRFTQQDEERIMSETRRRERVVLFLDLMEKKNSETFQAFSDILEEQSPHLFLALSQWDASDDEPDIRYGQGTLEDDWNTLHKYRDYLISQIDAGKISEYMKKHGVLSADQAATIDRIPDAERRTETFLDFLEMKPPEAFNTFLDSISDMYPHVFLELSSNGEDDDW